MSFFAAEQFGNVKWPVIVLVVVAVSIPLGVRYQNISAVVFGAYALYTLITAWRTLSWRRADWLLFLPIVLFLFFTVDLWRANNFQEGLGQIGKRLMLIVLPLGIFIIGKDINERDKVIVLRAFVCICLLLSLICYAGAIVNIVQNQSFRVVEPLERDYYYFSYLHLTGIVNLDPIYFSLFTNLAIASMIVYPLQKKWLTGCIIFYLSIFIFLIASKVGVIVFVLLFLSYLFSLIKRKLIGLGVICLAAIFFLVLVSQSGFLRERFIVPLKFDYGATFSGDWNSVSQRLAIWSCSLEAIKENFPWGAGTSNGKDVLKSVYIAKGYVRGYEDGYNPHNEFLFELLETGILGLFMLLFVLAAPFVVSLRKNYLMLSCFLLLIFFYFFVEVILARRIGVQFFAFFYALLTLNVDHYRKKTKENIG